MTANEFITLAERIQTLDSSVLAGAVLLGVLLLVSKYLFNGQSLNLETPVEHRRTKRLTTIEQQLANSAHLSADMRDALLEAKESALFEYLHGMRVNPKLRAHLLSTQKAAPTKISWKLLRYSHGAFQETNGTWRVHIGIHTWVFGILAALFGIATLYIGIYGSLLLLLSGTSISAELPVVTIALIAMGYAMLTSALPLYAAYIVRKHLAQPTPPVPSPPAPVGSAAS